MKAEKGCLPLYLLEVPAVRPGKPRTMRALKFSKMWVGGLLRRNALRRRRITASEKVLPDPAAVQAQMSQIQQTIEDDNYTPAEIISADETGGVLRRRAKAPSRARGRRALL